jgi:hypothetical protein
VWLSGGISDDHGVEWKLYDLDELVTGGLEGESTPWLDLRPCETERDVAEARGVDG